jgi:CubicO group peptidase (beta-lactamase class C family)
MVQRSIKYSLLLCIILGFSTYGCKKSNQENYYYPPAGNHISHHDQRQPEEVGLNPGIINEIKNFIDANPYRRSGRAYEPRWALWRNGYLIHVEGDFYKKNDVASLRKTWHAMIVGAAIQQGKIKDVHQKINEYVPELSGNHAEASWKDVLIQSAGFDYPYDTFPAYKPGEMWTYSDLSLVHLCNALAKVYGKENFYDYFDEVADMAYFDAIGMKGWETAIVRDASFGNRHDGVRYVINMEHMGRLGLLALARGKWNGKQLVPVSFVEALETKQTYGMKINYDGPNDGNIGQSEDEFPESPYGYLTWVNTDGDLFKGADKFWANASGAGGSKIMWNKNNGVVFVGFGLNLVSDNTNIPLIIEKNLVEANPLINKKSVAKVGQWSYYETSVKHAQETDHPLYKELLGNFTGPDGKSILIRGFYDGNQTWKVRFMPSLPGIYTYKLSFDNGKALKQGQFESQASDIPGLIHKYENNPIWFGYKHGNAELLRSLHIGDKFTADTNNIITGEPWSKAQRTRVLNWLQEQGYNTLSIASLFLNRDTEGRGKGWKTPDLWDSENQRPNYTEFQRLEKILEDLSIRKLLIYPFAGFLGRDSNFPNDDENGKLFLKYTMDRVGCYWNILYNVGGPEPLLKSRPYLSWDQVNYWGKLIDSLDVYQHLLSCHNYTGDDIFKDEPWTDYGILQGPKTIDRQRLNQLLLQNHHDKKPLYAQETLWPGNMYHPKYSMDDIRKNAITITMSASAINFADNDGNSSSGFSGTLDFNQINPEIHQEINRIWDLFESFPYYNLKPNQGRVDKGICLAKPDEYYLIYLPDGGKVAVALTGSKFEAQWINPKNFEKTESGGEYSGYTVFNAPDSEDWLLLLTKSRVGI